MALPRVKCVVIIINLLFQLLLFNEIPSMQCFNSEISLNETFQVFNNKNISIEINYPEIFDAFNASLKNDTNHNEFHYDYDDDINETVEKCCGFNEMYANFALKVCRVMENAEKFLRKFRTHFNRTLITSERGFRLCEVDEVIVEYDSVPFHAVSFNEGTLNVDGQGTFAKFCVDFNGDPKDDGEVKLVVRACMSKSICDSVLCIRKCCPGGEKLLLGNDSSSCVAFDGHFTPEFHNVRNWHTKEQVVEKQEVKGMELENCH